MRKYSVLLLFMIGFLLISTNASANSILDMMMKVHINEDGSVDVTEERVQNMTEGTENYMVFNDSDMGEVEITNFSVDGFEHVENWNSSGSLEDKAGKYGILDKFSSTELVFGIGEYSENTYTVNYTLENMVRNLEGGQSLYWNFDTFTGLRTLSFSMEITSDVPFEDVDYWGFGFNGDIQMIDDTIYWDSDGSLYDHNNVIVLLHFPEGTYATTVEDDTSIEEEREDAMDGSIYEDYRDEQNSMPNGLKWLFSILGGFFGIIIISSIVITAKVSKYKRNLGHIESTGAIIKRNRGYEEDVAPEIDDYAGIIFFVKHVTGEAFEALFQVFIMKWSDEGRISIEFTEGERWYESDTTSIQIHDFEKAEDTYQTELKEVGEAIKKKQYSGSYEALMWRFLFEMADENGVIDDKSMRSFAKKHAKPFGKLVDYLNEYSLEYLETHGYLELVKGTKFSMPIKIFRPTESGDALLNHLAQYKNYLKENDEDMLNNPFDESVLKDHLRWATLLGEHSRYERLLNKLIKQDDYHTHIYPYYLYHNSAKVTREQISTGLGEGGMHSSMSTAASGGGGSTGVGGGGGAGGGGGGGAR